MIKIALLIICLATYSSFFRKSFKKIVFLDVGQGDATLLQDGIKQVLIDGSPGMKVL